MTLIIVVFVILGIWYYYNVIEKGKNEVSYLTGKYIVNLEFFNSTESEELYRGYNFTFDKDNVTMTDGWGTHSVGTYTIKNNKIECIFTKWISESGGYFEFITEPVEFVFDIKDENTLIVEDSKRQGNIVDVINDKIGNFDKESIDYSAYDCFVTGTKFVKE